MRPSDESLQLAAQCWCDEETKDRIMDAELATAFAKRLDQLTARNAKLREALECALHGFGLLRMLSDRHDAPGGCNVNMPNIYKNARNSEERARAALANEEDV